MSSLTNLIPSQSVYLGTVNAQGKVTIDMTWYLLLYNIASQVLTTTSGVVSVSPTDLLVIGDGDNTADGVDTAQNGLNLNALQALVAQLTDDVPVGISALLDAACGSAQGDILYRDAYAWKALAPGTAADVLATGGTAANPYWTPTGNVVGPASSVNGDVAVFSGTTGKLLADGGALGTAAFIAAGINATITTAKLTSTGTNGSMTFTNGILSAQTPAT